MDEHLKQNYIQAKSLIEGFRLNISRLDSATREKSWKALESQVKALGFDSVQSVFDFEKEYALDLIMYADAGFKEVVRFVKTQKFLFALGARQLTIDGKIPNTLYISNLDRYYVLVSPDYDLAKEIDLDYCKGNGIIVRPSFIKRGDRPFGVICHGTGVIHVGGHLKDQGMFNYNALQLLVGEVLKRNNVPFVYSNNDGLINGSKIAGGLMWREDEILTVAFYISHHLDKTIYKGIFRDWARAEASYNRISSLDANGYDIDAATLQSQIIEKLEKRLGAIELSDLTKDESCLANSI